MRRSRHFEEPNQLDISPLIDMVFILLIFFMVSTTFVKDMKIDIQRPGASSSEQASSKSIRVYIDKQTNIHLDGQSVRPWVLQNKLREMLAARSTKLVLVVTDRTVPAEKLVEVVDQCRLAGAEDVGVATENET